VLIGALAWASERGANGAGSADDSEREARSSAGG
jgi:hypothetical protein